MTVRWTFRQWRRSRCWPPGRRARRIPRRSRHLPSASACRGPAPRVPRQGAGGATESRTLADRGRGAAQDAPPKVQPGGPGAGGHTRGTPSPAPSSRAACGIPQRRRRRAIGGGGGRFGRRRRRVGVERRRSSASRRRRQHAGRGPVRRSGGVRSPASRSGESGPAMTRQVVPRGRCPHVPPLPGLRSHRATVPTATGATTTTPAGFGYYYYDPWSWYGYGGGRGYYGQHLGRLLRGGPGYYGSGYGPRLLRRRLRRRLHGAPTPRPPRLEHRRRPPEGRAERRRSLRRRLLRRHGRRLRRHLAAAAARRRRPSHRSAQAWA